MIWGLLLAAGGGSRFNGHKLLHPDADGIPVALAAARNLAAALPAAVAVVREGDHRLARLLAAEGMCVVANPRAAEGMGTSLAQGVAAVADAAGWVVALADMPYIRPESIRGVAGLLHSGAELAAPEYAGRRGHPVGFGRRYRTRLLRLRGDSGARHVLAQDANRLRLLRVDDPGVLIDIDTPADLERGRRRE